MPTLEGIAILECGGNLRIVLIDIDGKLAIQHSLLAIRRLRVNGDTGTGRAVSGTDGAILLTDQNYVLFIPVMIIGHGRNGYVVVKISRKFADSRC